MEYKFLPSKFEVKKPEVQVTREKGVTKSRIVYPRQTPGRVDDYDDSDDERDDT